MRKKLNIMYLGALILIVVIVLVIGINMRNNESGVTTQNNNTQSTTIGSGDGDEVLDESKEEEIYMEDFQDDITLTFDEGCAKDFLTYLDHSTMPESAADDAIMRMQTYKCFAQLLENDIYSTEPNNVLINEEDAMSNDTDNPIYEYVYIYGKDIDYNNDVYVVQKDGNKTYPNELSIISDEEAYLIFEVNEGMESIDKVLLKIGNKEYNLLDIYLNLGL